MKNYEGGISAQQVIVDVPGKGGVDFNESDEDRIDDQPVVHRKATF